MLCQNCCPVLPVNLYNLDISTLPITTLLPYMKVLTNTIAKLDMRNSAMWRHHFQIVTPPDLPIISLFPNVSDGSPALYTIIYRHPPQSIWTYFYPPLPPFLAFLR